MPTKHLGFVGLGRMGGPMASRLLDAGYTLSVFDTNDAAMRPLVDRGAKAASSPAEVASEAAIVLMSFPIPVSSRLFHSASEGSSTGPRSRH